jgi:1,4-alpha-glucan branching enzyme
VPRDHYVFGAPVAGRYRKLLDSDDVAFGGSGYAPHSETETSAEPWRDFPARIHLTLPPLSMVVWAHD